VHAVPISGAWANFGKIAMPDKTVDLRKIDSYFVFGDEQSQLHPIGNL